jgi:RNA polymerase sigma-70 factor (ECF subfamily)
MLRGDNGPEPPQRAILSVTARRYGLHSSGQMVETRADVEQGIRAAIAAQDFQTAATQALEAYGREIISFLFARLRNSNDAQDAFSIFVEDFWRSLPSFGFRCSMRVWMYTLARNAGIRHGKAAYRKRELNLSSVLRDSVSALIDHARTETQVHLRTAARDKLRAFREQLDPDDRMLLTLHVDRALPWRDVAMVLLPDGERLESRVLDREATRLRKRFERVKAELRVLAKREGLVRS